MDVSMDIVASTEETHPRVLLGRQVTKEHSLAGVIGLVKQVKGKGKE